MRILVTGATGVIGRRAVPLLAKAHQVTAVARSARPAERLRMHGATPITLDLFDPRAVRRAVDGHDAVINLATHIPPASKAFLPGAWRENHRLRRDAARNLADAVLAAGVGHFVQESYAGIYPDCGDEWIDETVPPRPARHARSVLDAERHAQRTADGGRVAVVLRFALLYGPDSSHTRDTIRYVRKGTAPTFGRREAFVSSVATDDAATAVVAALGAPSGVYNVCDDEPVRRHTYFESLARALGVGAPWMPPPWVSKIAGSVGETIARSQRVSNAKIKGVTTWSPTLRTVSEGWPVIVRQLESSPG